MKNRRNLIVAFLLCACLIVGIGYASLVETLNITADANLTNAAAEEEFQNDIYFSAVSDVDNCAAVVSLADNDKVAVTITDDNSTMAVKGDKAFFKATIKNDAAVDAELTFSHTATENFEMKVVDNEGNHTADYTVTVPANGEITINVSVELLNNIAEDITDSGFSVTIKATALTTVTPAN